MATYYVPLRVIRPRCVYASMEDLRAVYPDIHILDVMQFTAERRGDDDGTD